MHEADLTRKYDCTQLDVVELRAVYGAVKSIRWRDVKGHADGRGVAEGGEGSIGGVGGSGAARGVTSP